MASFASARVGPKHLFFIFCTLTACLCAQALDNGVSITPVMGYNTWNAFDIRIDEQLIMDTADAMVRLGLVDAGYTYLNIDDGWHSPERGSDGSLLPDPDRFPSGLAALADYVHSKGLRFGIYSDAGSFTCAGFPGSRGHEMQDAATFAAWGFDYLKYDNCYASADDDLIGRYTAMQDALNATGRPIVFSLCEWGVAQPWLWARAVGNSWRTTRDITPTWDSIIANLDNSVGLARFAGPGGWNDPDMLEVGNGALTLAERRAHFALWALLKAPLLVGADLRTLDAESLRILLSKEVIAVHQDPLGAAGDLIWKQGGREVWASSLADGSRAAIFFDRHDVQYKPASISVRWSELGWPAAAKVAVRDLFAGADLGVFQGGFTAQVDDPHGVVMVRVTRMDGDGTVAGDDGWRPWHGQKMYEEHMEDGAPDKLVAASVVAAVAFE